MLRSLVITSILCLPVLTSATASACPMKQSPRLVANIYKKAQKAERKKQHLKALRLYQRVMHTDRRSSRQFKAAMRASRVAKRLKRFRVMERLIRFAIKRRPKSARAHTALGFALLSKDPGAAIQSLVRASELGVKNPGDVLAAMAEGFARQGKGAMASRTLAKAIKSRASEERVRSARAAMSASVSTQTMVKN